MRVRAVVREDLSALKSVIGTNGLFPPEMLDDMAAAYLGGKGTDDLWFTASENVPVAVAYCAPERMTLGTWNLLLIAVEPGHQGRGIGTALARHIEEVLRERGARVLLVETSALPEFEAARAFYRKAGYREEARIRDYYQAGEDKIVFHKALR